MIIDHTTETGLGRLPKADHIGDAISNAKIETGKAWKVTAFVSWVVTIVFAFSTVTLALRPVQNRYIRIDSIAHAEPIKYSDLSYSPREGELRNFLETWMQLKFSWMRGNVVQTSKNSYYFEDGRMAQREIADESRDQAIAKVATGENPENSIEINGVQFISLTKETVKKSVLAKGQAILDFYKIFDDDGTGSKREHWTSIVTFYLDPSEVSDRAEKDPQFETMNPLGLVITEHHETRLAR